jgi:hypothetical protein
MVQVGPAFWPTLIAAAQEGEALWRWSMVVWVCSDYPDYWVR